MTCSKPLDPFATKHLSRKNTHFAFDDLNPYVQQSVLKYLRIKDRIRYERVSKKFAHNLQLMWSRTQTLSLKIAAAEDSDRFLAPFTRLATEVCPYRSHHYRGNDVFVVKFESKKHLNRALCVFLNILQKCGDTLKALDIECASYDTLSNRQLNNILSYCLNLEHFSFSDCHAFGAKYGKQLNLANFDASNLLCVTNENDSIHERTVRQLAAISPLAFYSGHLQPDMLVMMLRLGTMSNLQPFTVIPKPYCNNQVS